METEQFSGIALQYVSFDFPERISYLKQRGVAMFAQLDAGEGTVRPGTVVEFDQDSPYIRALIAICADELGTPPRIPEGSSDIARTALFNGYIEQTEWMRYVDAEQDDQ